MSGAEVLLHLYGEISFARLDRIWRAMDLPPMASMAPTRAVLLGSALASIVANLHGCAMGKGIDPEALAEAECAVEAYCARQKA